MVESHWFQLATTENSMANFLQCAGSSIRLRRTLSHQGGEGGRHNRVPKFLKEKTLAIRSTHLEVARPFPDCFEERQGIGTILCAAGVSKMQQ